MSCDFTHLDGVYVLGSLAPAERAEFERHLHGCDECARSVRELAGLPGLLSRAPVDVLERPGRVEAAPETLLPALVIRVAREQRRRTARLAGLAAAAVAVVAVGTAGVMTALREDGPPSAAPPAAVETTAAPQRLTSVGAGSVTGWVSLTPVAWGTRLDLTCEYEYEHGHGYGDGGAEGTTYTMFVRTTDGRIEEAATWRALPGSEMHVTGATSADPEAIAALVVRTSDGEPVLRLTP